MANAYQQVITDLQTAQNQSQTERYKKIREAVRLAMSTSAGPNAADLTNYTDVRLMLPYEAATPREMATTGPAWKTGNDLKFRFCINDARTFDVAGANKSTQENVAMVIRAFGLRYNYDIAEADLQNLQFARARITATSGSTNFVTLDLPLSEILTPEQGQAGYQNTTNTTTTVGNVIPVPVKVSTPGPLMIAMEPIFVRENGYIELEITQLPNAPAATSGVKLRPVMVVDQFLTGS